MLYTEVLDEYKIDYEEYLREREVDFFGMKDRYLKYIQTKGVDHFVFKPIKITTNTGHIYIIRYSFNAYWKHKFIPLIVRCYRQPEGIYVVTCPSTIITVGKNAAYIPHFFDRYRDRILKRKHCNKLDVIMKFFENEAHYGVGAMIQNDKYPNNYIFASDKFITLGSPLEDVNIFEMRTLISLDMLKEMQKDICNELVELGITEGEGHSECKDKNELLRFLLKLPNYKEV